MKNSLKNLIKTSIIFLSLFLALFILPLCMLKDASNDIMKITFASEIVAAVAITLTYISFKNYKDKQNVNERNQSYKHSKRIEQSVSYYEVANEISEKGNRVIHIFNAA